METAITKAGKHTPTPVQSYPAGWLKEWTENKVPDSEGQGIHIIVVDTPAYLDHPCFASQYIAEAWEFISTAAGRQIYPRASQPANAQAPEARTLNEKFSAHGTAIMGLLCSQNTQIEIPQSLICELPIPTATHLPAIEDADGETALNTEAEPVVTVELPGLGLTPEATMYLMALSFDSEPDPYRQAFEKVIELIDQGGQWVIIMPRGIPRPDPASDIPGDDTTEQWQALDSSIQSIAMGTPFFYAAGNGQEDQAGYPGTLFPEEIRTDLLFSVGAENSRGEKSSYSAVADIYYPSDDAEAIYRDTNAGDIYYLNPANTDHLDDPFRKLKAQGSDYNFRRIVTTDVPGRYGYNPGTLETDHFDITTQYQKDLTSLFCEFGGTSAATAVAGAFAARGLSSGVVDLSDISTFRDWMKDQAE